ncbi:MAG TPA: DUF2914 domain-containing protein [Candidatus Paceibacterota bacterium]|nr:DUF2914 domain-containing protein [Candidatus Paceibacterota bacterium]
MVRSILAWAQRNERHLGALVFFFGFITDLVALLLLDVSFVLALSGLYLALAAVAVFFTHTLSHWRDAKIVWKRSLTVIFPLAAQYLIGNLLSWFLIFYAKSAVWQASWPFLVLLLLVFLGNEWFRKYKDRLAFVAVLLFFVTYAYAIFALPLILRTLGPWIFLGSTALALAAFGLFLFALSKTGKRIAASLAPIIGSVFAIVVVVVASYFTGLIPPLPLALKDSGIFHELSREGAQYVVRVEDGNEWWDIRPDTYHVPMGTPLVAYGAVQAPIRFGATVVHRWQRYNEEARSWVTQSRVAFPITGGREEGYRGYSEIAYPVPGEWRVRVETESGQVIGQMRFRVERGTPVLHTEYR